MAFIYKTAIMGNWWIFMGLDYEAVEEAKYDTSTVTVSRVYQHFNGNELENE